MNLNQRKISFLIGAGVFLAVCASFFVNFLDHHQAFIDSGLGWKFNDPILNWLPAYDLSIPIFSITYGSLFLYLILNFREWVEKLGIMAFSYSIIIIIRYVSLLLLPLEEPVNLITMNDPFLDGLIYPGETTADLFFSGHMSTLVLLTFHSSKKLIFFVLTVALGLMLMIQHIHYSIDVFAAIPFALLTGYFSRLVYRSIVKTDVSK